MSISQKNIIIAGAAAVAVLIVIVVIVVSRSGPVTSGIFTRCDGLADPIEPISINSCQDYAKAGICQIKADTDTTFDFTFTTANDFTKATLAVTGPNTFSTERDLCGTAPGQVTCPTKAGTKLHPVASLSFKNLAKADSVQLQMKVYDPAAANKQVLYCVEFPAKVV